jgi:hypothetical protein
MEHSPLVELARAVAYHEADAYTFLFDRLED